MGCVRACGPAVSNNGSSPITRPGNRRLRTALIELAWRQVRLQPTYAPLQKWRGVWFDFRASAAARKKAIVAVGRHLALDLWRLNTGRTTLEKPGLN